MVEPAASGSPDRRVGYIAALVALVLIGTALRAHNLSHWPLAGDELFTLRDSISPQGYQKTRPLLYAMNYFLVRPLTSLDELGLRLLPAIFGILSIPVMYLLGRRLLSPRAGVFAALLVTFSQIHVYHSQEARYWSLVFLLSAIYPFAIYLGLRERRRGYLVLGLAGAVLATLAHPSATLLLGGVFLWYLITVWPEKRRTSPGRGYWVEGVIAVVVLAVAVWMLFPILESWVSTPRLERLRGPALLLSYADSLSATLVLLAILGVWWLWQGGQRSLAVLLASLAVVPPLLLTGLSLFAAVATSYLWATAPAIYLGAAAFLDRLAASSLPRAERAVVVGALLGIILAGNVPLLVSHYRDGGRPDFRQAARFLAPRLGPDDRVLSDQSRLLTHYLPRPDIVSLSREPEQLAEQYAGLGGSRGRLWIVALTSSRGGFKSHKLGLGNLSEWVHGRCQLLEQIGVARLDFRQNEVQIYRCPPESAPTP